MTCSWEIDPGCLDDTWDSYTPELRERAVMLATSALQTLTYNRVGTCPITIRPCPPAQCGCGGWAPVLVDGGWYNCSTCGASRCAPLSEVDLPGPVGYIESVRINGVEQDLMSDDWRLDSGHLLVWQGAGPSPIPAVQNLNRPDTEVGTWSITYSRSYPVGPDARLAVGELAKEFAKACSPRGKCSLPRGVTNVTRSGVSFTIEAGMFPGGLTGNSIADQFILKWAPAGAPTATAVVFNPRRAGKTSRVTSRLPVTPPWSGGGSL